MQGYLNDKPSPEKQPFSTFKPWTVAVPDHHHLRIPPNQGAIPPEEGSECAREWHMQKWRFGKVVWLGLSAHWDLLGQTPFKRHYFWHNLGQIMRLSLSSSQFEQSRIKFNTGAFDSTVTKTCSNCYKMSEKSYCSYSSDWIPVNLLKISRLWGSAFIACSAIHKSCSSWCHKWTDQAPQHWMSAPNLVFSTL